MQLRELVLDSSLRELTVRGEPGYPLAMYDNDMEGFLGGNIPWHWHREIELVYVRRGRLAVESEGLSMELAEGEGAFLNSGVLHRMGRIGREGCGMVTMVFDPGVLSGSQTSLLHSKYILPLIQCRGLPVIRLEREMMERMELAFDAYCGSAFDRELVIRQLLTEVWLGLLTAHREKLAEGDGRGENKRLKVMLGYLQENLAEAIRLEDVAAAANVSARECTRCFREALHTSPMAYLTQLRVRTAAAMLQQTEDPVTEIGLAVGFGSPSYFGKVFREHTGMSPREYRRREMLNDEC